MHMLNAMDEHPELAIDENATDDETVVTIAETREAMVAYFKYTAHYIVVASEYMRDDQLSGGTRIDEGRVW